VSRDITVVELRGFEPLTLSSGTLGSYNFRICLEHSRLLDETPDDLPMSKIGNGAATMLLDHLGPSGAISF
jgi:hypothetical protein